MGNDHKRAPTPAHPSKGREASKADNDLQAGLGNKDFSDWLEASWSNKHARKDGSIHESDYAKPHEDAAEWLHKKP